MDNRKLFGAVSIANIVAAAAVLAAGIAIVITRMPDGASTGHRLLAWLLAILPPLALIGGAVGMRLGRDWGRLMSIGYAVFGVPLHAAALAIGFVHFALPAMLTGRAAVAIFLLVAATLVSLAYDLFLLAVLLRTKISVIARRELGSAFTSPLAYMALAGFLLLVGVLFASGFEPGLEASLRQLFSNIVMVLVLAIPLLTMPLFSEEYSRGTIETMMTAPVTEVDLTLGKFFGVFGFYVALLATTLPHYVLLSAYGQPEAGQALVGYLGMLLVGGAFIAIGLFFSAVTRYQLLAALLSALALAAVTLLPLWLRQLSGFWAGVARYVSVPANFDNFSKGIVDTRSLVFFASVMVFFLFVSVKVLESRRWR